jgi:hypothetical protein
MAFQHDTVLEYVLVKSLTVLDSQLGSITHYAVLGRYLIDRHHVLGMRSFLYGTSPLPTYLRNDHASWHAW